MQRPLLDASWNEASMQRACQYLMGHNELQRFDRNAVIDVFAHGVPKTALWRNAKDSVENESCGWLNRRGGHDPVYMWADGYVPAGRTSNQITRGDVFGALGGVCLPVLGMDVQNAGGGAGMTGFEGIVIDSALGAGITSMNMGNNSGQRGIAGAINNFCVVGVLVLPHRTRYRLRFAGRRRRR